ncbi:MAG TPA: LamG domain-containing protein [Verrucomicrobiae bacterium]
MKFEKALFQTFGCILLISSVATTSLHAVPTDVPSGLVAWWNGNDNSEDSTLNQLDASWLGTPAYVNGKVGRAFDVRASALSVPHSSLVSFAPGSHATFEFWAYRTSSDLPFHIFGKRAGACPTIQINYQLGVDNTLPAVPLNEWVHWAAVFDASGITWYANGAVYKSFPGATFGAQNTADLRLGTSGVCEAFDGYIDEFSIYNRGLTLQEIQSIYQAGSGGKRQIQASAEVYAGITLQAGVGTSCFIQYAESLNEPVQWITLTNIASIPSSPYFFVDRTSSAKVKRFYRVISSQN